MKATTTCLGLLALASAALHAGTPLGGITTAVSGDGARLVAAGDTRTLLVLDPATLEVKERHWIETSIVNLAFNEDGTLLVAQDTSETLLVFDTADWSKKTEIPKQHGFAVSPGANLVAGHDNNSRGATVSVHSLGGGTAVFSTTLPDGTNVASLALSADGSKLAVLTQGIKDETEPEVPSAQLPKDIRGFELDEFKQKNDGKTSTLFLYDLASQNKASETKTWYTTNTQSILAFSGDDLFSVNYNNLNAKITPGGETTLFQAKNSLNYGIGATPTGSHFLTGGLGSYSITSAADFDSVDGKIDKLPGWPEYWKGFAATADGGTLYGTTSAYRIFRLDPAGKIQTSAPVR